MKKIITIFLVVFYININAQVICFNSSTNYSACTAPNDVTVADFNNDGKKDILVANVNSDSLSLFINNGSGGFGTAINFYVGSGQSGVISADFNKDGNADIAFCNANISSTGIDTLAVMLGTGLGTFGSPATYTTGGSYNGGTSSGMLIYSGMVSADFNGDSIADLAVSNVNTAYVSILLGNGTGGFSSITGFNATGGSQMITDITTGDFNNDGKVDIAGVIPGIFGVTVMLGDGIGNFGSPNITVGWYAMYYLTNADFDEDTKMDVALTGYSVLTMPGNGAGSFGQNTSFPAGTGAYGICTGDFNNDGHADIVATNHGSNNISVLVGTGTNLFSSPYNFPVDSTPTSVVAEDFNSDGYLDVAVTNSSSNNITVLLSCAPTSTCVAAVSFSIGQDTAYTSTWDIIPHYSPQVDSAVWNWGDGTTSSGLYPSHIYAQPNFYTQCVTVYNNCGDSATTCVLDSVFRLSYPTNNSNMVYVNVIHESSTGFAQIKNQNTEIKIYPSPTSSILQVLLGNCPEEEIETYDVLGNLVKVDKLNKQNNINQMDVSSLKSGVYFIRAGNNSRKFIKQ